MKAHLLLVAVSHMGPHGPLLCVGQPSLPCLAEGLPRPTYGVVGSSRAMPIQEQPCIEQIAVHVP